MFSSADSYAANETNMDNKKSRMYPFWILIVVMLLRPNPSPRHVIINGVGQRLVIVSGGWENGVAM